MVADRTAVSTDTLVSDVRAQGDCASHHSRGDRAHEPGHARILNDADRDSPSLLRPLRIPLFRSLFIADLLSDTGAFMQSVGAAWLMVSLGASATFVALTQTASSLPFFLLALPAGAIGNIVDRRKLILCCEYWMAGVASLLATATMAGVMSPWLLLALTFALSAGEAMETPTWRALLPELVGKPDLAAASAVNGIEFNLARAAGPALAGAVIAAAGVSAAFVANAMRRSRSLRWEVARDDDGHDALEPLAPADHAP